MLPRSLFPTYDNYYCGPYSNHDPIEHSQYHRDDYDYFNHYHNDCNYDDINNNHHVDHITNYNDNLDYNFS